MCEVLSQFDSKARENYDEAAESGRVAICGAQEVEFLQKKKQKPEKKVHRK